MLSPFYEDDMTIIYCGDNREIMPHLDLVDHVITDPPYGEKTHAGARGGGNGELVLVNFASITDDEFLVFVGRAVQLARRWVVMTCEWRHAARLEMSSLPLVRLGVWLKPNGAPQFTGDRPGTGWEAVAILHREGKKRWNGGGHHAVWTFNKEPDAQNPTAKPLPLLLKWIAQFTDPGEMILDPYMGSGTTLVAAKTMGRRAIGIEINEAQCKIAVERLMQRSLFSIQDTCDTRDNNRSQREFFSA